MSCSEEPTSPEIPVIELIGSIPQDIYFTASDYDARYEVDEYAYGDSVFVQTFERGIMPLHAPLWIYAHYSGDKEMFMMYSRRHIIPEDAMFVYSFLPNTDTGAMPFNGTLRVLADGDSITAYYFSQTQMRIVHTGVRIGNP